MVIERARNRAEDIRAYHLQYWDRRWPKDDRLRQITVHLLPRVLHPPRLRRIIGEVLEALNQKQPVLPDGSGRRLNLRLAKRTELKVSIDANG